MSYYTSGFTSCALNARDVVENLSSTAPIIISTSAQCGAFALLLESALAMNGIHSNWTTVQPTDQSNMVVHTCPANEGVAARKYFSC
jgi:hypothetical protein